MLGPARAALELFVLAWKDCTADPMDVARMSTDGRTATMEGASRRTLTTEDVGRMVSRDWLGRTRADLPGLLEALRSDDLLVQMEAVTQLQAAVESDERAREGVRRSPATQAQLVPLLAGDDTFDAIARVLATACLLGSEDSDRLASESPAERFAVVVEDAAGVFGPEARCAAARELSSLAQQGVAQQRSILAANVVPGLVTMLRSPATWKEAAAALGHVAMKFPDAQAVILDTPALPHLAVLLADPAPATVVEALTAIGRLCWRNPAGKLAALALDLGRKVVALAESRDADIRRLAAELIESFSGAAPEGQDVLRAAGALPALARFLRHLDLVPLEVSARAVRRLIADHAGNREAAREAGVVPALLATLERSDTLLTAAVLREVQLVLAELMAGSDANRAVVEGARGAAIFRTLVLHSHVEVRVVGWSLFATFSATSPARTNELVGLLMDALRSRDRARHVEVVFELAVLAESRPAVRQRIVDLGGAPLLADVLESDDSEARTWAVEALGRIASGGPGPQAAIVRTGAVKKLLSRLFRDEQVRTTWALRRLAYRNPGVQNAIRDAGALPVFVRCLGDSSAVLRRQAAHILFLLAQDDSDCVLSLSAIAGARDLCEEAWRKSHLGVPMTWTHSGRPRRLSSVAPADEPLLPGVPADGPDFTESGRLLAADPVDRDR